MDKNIGLVLGEVAKIMFSGDAENDEVSMVDVLDEDNELEAEANAVLGDSDDQNCTYDKVWRIIVYECLMI